MAVSNVNLTVRFGGRYYKLKKGEEVIDLPKNLEKSLLRKDYIEGYFVEEPTPVKKRRKKAEVIPEETISMEEISEFEFELDIPKEEHKIKEEHIFDYRKEDTE